MTETGELTYRRVHRGVARVAVRRMTTPEHLTHFWGPVGTTTPVANITVDLRPGGVFETTMVSDADGSTLHDARRLRGGPPPRPAGVDRGRRRRRHADNDHLRRPARRAHRGGHPPDQRAGRISQRRGEGRLRHQPRPLRRLRRRSPHPARTREYECQRSRQPTAPRSPTSTPAPVRPSSSSTARCATAARGRCDRSPRCCRTAFTVYTYDRRGRGESSDTLPYAVAREVEDLQALVAQAGGEACVYAISSGAALALQTAASRRRDHQAGALRTTVHGRGRRRRQDQGVHRTASPSCLRPGRGATPSHSS